MREQQIPFVISKELSAHLIVTQQELTKPYDAMAVFKTALDGAVAKELIRGVLDFLGLDANAPIDPAAAQALEDLRRSWPASIPTKEQRAVENFRASMIADAISKEKP